MNSVIYGHIRIQMCTNMWNLTLFIRTLCILILSWGLYCSVDDIIAVIGNRESMS